MPDHPDTPPGDHDEILAARLTDPTDTLPSDPGAQIADPRFAVVLRGYDRAAVDAYVERATRLVDELNASRSPREAVRQALERVGEETTAILRGAHDAAEQVTRGAQAEADELRTRTQTEADELRTRTQTEAHELRTRTQTEADALEASSREEAQVRMEAAERQVHATLASTEQRAQDLDRDVDAVWQERQRLIDDVQRIAGELGGLATDAEARFPAEPEPEATVEIPAAERPDAENPPERDDQPGDEQP
jgi:DivIVA domain-containing protein